LNDLRERVDAWRKQQGKRSRIPQELWDAAVRVARTDGLWVTSRATRFNYENLRQQMEMAVRRQRRSGHKALAVPDRGEVGRSVPAKLTSAFVELPASMLDRASRTVIDMLGRNGERMRIEVGGCVDVVGLAQAFWSQQP
jgi:hypothetical protein